MWERDDWIDFFKWTLIFSPAAVAIGAGFAVLPDRMDQAAPPATVQSVTETQTVWKQPETETVTMSRHARPEPSTTYSVPQWKAEERIPSSTPRPEPAPLPRTPEPTPQSPVTVTTTPPVATPTPSVQPPVTTTPPVTPEPRVETTPEPTTTAPSEFVADPIYQQLVREFRAADPLGSYFV